MSKLFTLSAKERIKSRKDIETLFQSGKAFLIYPFRVLYRSRSKEETDAPLQFMVSVPKRNFRKATARNRIRRQIKEAYRLHKIALQPLLVQHQVQVQCAFVFMGKEAPAYHVIEETMKRSLQRLQSELQLQ
ncbi:MAG: ribonuclease P protein component [Chitinophagaceae bacterium]|nr:ribonuclease P protein component [Chitinophagaceae bacterium]